MGKRAGGRDFAPRVRSAFDRVLQKLEANGEIDSLIEAQIREDCVGTLAKASSYVTKQAEVSITNTIESHVLSMVSKQITQDTDDSSTPDNLH